MPPYPGSPQHSTARVAQQPGPRQVLLQDSAARTSPPSQETTTEGTVASHCRHGLQGLQENLLEIQAEALGGSVPIKMSKDEPPH